jgi:hypothetical protein
MEDNIMAKFYDYERLKNTFGTHVEYLEKRWCEVWAFVDDEDDFPVDEDYEYRYELAIRYPWSFKNEPSYVSTLIMPDGGKYTLHRGAACGQKCILRGVTLEEAVKCINEKIKEAEG